MISDRSTRVLQWGALAGLLLVLPGCLLVGHMEHRVERQADGSALVSVRYIDLHTRFVDAIGQGSQLFDADGVHLAPKGYELWSRVLKEIFPWL